MQRENIRPRGSKDVSGGNNGDEEVASLLSKDRRQSSFDASLNNGPAQLDEALQSPLSGDGGDDAEDPSGKSTAMVVAGNGASPSSAASEGITSIGLKVLILLAFQNSSKNLLMRYVMKDKPDILASAAVIGSDILKMSASIFYILVVEGKPFSSIVQYFREDWKNTLLIIVPASAYSLQMSLEYVALANLDAAMFSVLVQTKLLCTAIFAAIVLRKKLKYIQVVSLVLLTVGVMLCNLRFNKSDEDDDEQKSATKGILATLGISLSSGFASVYTEKVIKTQRAKTTFNRDKYSLAYTQVQLAGMSLIVIGLYACVVDMPKIIEHGLFHNFNFAARLTIVNSAVGGLIVASVLKFADSVLKGYATAVSVVLTGTMSMVLFGTQLHTVYFLGIINVIASILLYNGKNLDQLVC
eukprot:CAMPEP_0119552212 /NCGR_PEP_ID=MMETSP1352-20130426/5273_1 /TAXON_ID=265584 /ORGANISM="Stauroneis constricta, Strain CCMP1120" /LENGTH=411 /DNA_ID=CAMNT_0007598407 /DNA_START=71 /DNA_END=1306 /DNA_ORIENTATION=-